MPEGFETKAAPVSLGPIIYSPEDQRKRRSIAVLLVQQHSHFAKLQQQPISLEALHAVVDAAVAFRPCADGTALSLRLASDITLQDAHGKATFVSFRNMHR
jgi:hypothetical protein